MLKLRKYQVAGFRSVADSGWIETDKVTALIGVNESGKTNLLLPLWKLNPANEGSIVPIADYPRSEYTERRQQKGKQVFVRGQFETDEAFQDELAKLTNLPKKNFETVQFDRLFDGNYLVKFPEVDLPTTAKSQELGQLLSETKAALDGDSSSETHDTPLLAAINEAAKILESFNGQRKQARPHLPPGSTRIQSPITTPTRIGLD